jgi:hypothetical protein
LRVRVSEVLLYLILQNKDKFSVEFLSNAIYCSSKMHIIDVGENIIVNALLWLFGHVAG